MSNCLRCIHQAVCANSEIEPINCIYFIDKYVLNVPNVGDEIYIISADVIVKQEVKRIENEKELIVTNFFNIIFDELGKSVFLSEEKAREKMRSNK